MDALSSGGERRGQGNLAPFPQAEGLTTRHEVFHVEQNRSEAAAQPADVTNVAIAEKLGVDHSTVSRIRHGQRYPSRELMRRVAEKYGWLVVHQLDLLPDKGRNMRYAHEFEKKVCS